MTLLMWILAAFALWGALTAYNFWRWSQEVDALMAQRNVNDPAIRDAHWLASGPRAPVYRFFATLTAFASTALIWPLITSIWRWVWNYYDRPGDLEEGLAPWTFFMAIFTSASWIAIGSAFIYFFYKRAPTPNQRTNARALDRGDAFV